MTVKEPIVYYVPGGCLKLRGGGGGVGTCFLSWQYRSGVTKFHFVYFTCHIKISHDIVHDIATF